jgi:nucleoside-diphosphate-sugar epimerase
MITNNQICKALIVGGAGYVGGYLVDLLKHNNYDVTVYDNLLYETRFLKQVNFINGDIRDKQKLSSILPDYECVIWLAGIVGDGACQINVDLTNEINYESVKWLSDNYTGKICFPSTCSVYGVNNELIDETAVPHPLSAYASTKLAAEQYLIKNSENILIFRLGTLYGLSDTYSRLRLDLVVNVLTKKAVSGEPLSVFGGEQWRPLLHVKDVGRAFLYGIENHITGLYNLSILDIANKIRDVIKNTKIDCKDIKFEDLRNYKVDNTKFLQTGFIPRFNVESGIVELQSIFEQNRIVDMNDPVYSNVDFLKGIHGKLS